MTTIALIFSLSVVGLGVLGLVAPSRLLSIDRYFQTPAGLYFAAAIRVAMGVALFLAAPASLAPEAIRILGVVIVVAGVATLFFGLDRLRGLVDWWSAHRSALIRPFAVLALVFGLLLTYALVP